MIQALVANRVEDPESFLRERVGEVVMLKEHAVTAGFMSQVEESVSKSLDEHSWSEVKIDGELSKEDKEILRGKICAKLQDVKIIGDYIVREDIAGKLEELCGQVARQKSESAWAKRTCGIAADTPTTKEVTRCSSTNHLS